MLHKTIESNFIAVYYSTYFIILKFHRSIYRLFPINKIEPNIAVSYQLRKIKHHKKELKVINYRKMAIIKTLPFSYKSLLLR